MGERLLVAASARKHGLSDEDICHAWRNAVAKRVRSFDPPCHEAAAGADKKGRMRETLAAEREDGTIIVYHAMLPTGKMASELGLC